MAVTMSGNLYVISAPSGAGKTTISNALRARGLVSVSVSHTTRPPRPSETAGEAYFFVGRAEFHALREQGKFLEWAEVYGNLYGTSGEWVDAQLAAGKNVLLEIDCQGAAQVKQARPAAALIFIAPPSLEALRERLCGRGEDADEVAARRLAQAEAEMARQNEYDYVIINDDLQTAVARIAEIISAA